MPSERPNASKETLTVQVRSRNVTYFNGQAASVSSENNKGAFDILPRHTRFISLIQHGVVVRQTDGSEKKIDFENAVLKVRDNTVEIYIGGGK